MAIILPAASNEPCTSSIKGNQILLFFAVLPVHEFMLRSSTWTFARTNILESALVLGELQKEVFCFMGQREVEELYYVRRAIGKYSGREA